MLVAAFIVGCGGSGDAGGSAASCSNDGAPAPFDPGSASSITVGSDIPYPPFEDGSPGEYAGFDVDVIDAIASKLGLPVEIEDTDYADLPCALAEGKIDLIASALPITPRSQRTMSFSEPYYEAQLAILVDQGGEISKPAELAGATVGVQAGTEGATYAAKAIGDGTVREFNEATDAVNALLAGQVDAVVIDQAVAHDAVVTEGLAKLDVADEIPSRTFYGLAVAKQNGELLDAVDSALRELKRDGTLGALYRRYFGIAAPASVLGRDDVAR